jgi:MYXO-CTERM domain-containing protein
MLSVSVWLTVTAVVVGQPLLGCRQLRRAADGVDFARLTFASDRVSVERVPSLFGGGVEFINVSTTLVAGTAVRANFVLSSPFFSCETATLAIDNSNLTAVWAFRPSAGPVPMSLSQCTPTPAPTPIPPSAPAETFPPASTATPASLSTSPPLADATDEASRAGPIAEDGPFDVGLIVGAAVGAVAFLALVALVLLWLRRRRRESSQPPSRRDVDMDTFSHEAIGYVQVPAESRVEKVSVGAYGAVPKSESSHYSSIHSSQYGDLEIASPPQSSSQYDYARLDVGMKPGTNYEAL